MISKSTYLGSLSSFSIMLQYIMSETYIRKGGALQIKIGNTQPTDGSIWFDTTGYEGEESKDGE